MKVTDYTGEIKNSVLQRASLFLRLMTNEMTLLSEPKTPKKTGRLRMDVLKQVLGLNGKVVWGKKYAAILEEKQFRNYTTPGTNKDYAKNAAKLLPIKTESVARRAGLI